MSAGTTFAKASNFVMRSPDKGHTKLVQVKIGTHQTPLKCLLMDQAGGAQPFRTQYDIALDGSEYVLAAGKGRGNYTLQLLEGPIKDCNHVLGAKDMTIHQLYKTQMGTLKGRKITIVTGTNPNSTSQSWVFTGIIDQIATSAQIGEDGYRYITNVISATGMWR